MNEPDGYRLSKCLVSSEEGDLFLAHDDATGRRVLIRSFRGAGAVNTARRAHERLRKLAGPGIPAVRELDVGGPEPLLVMGALDAEPLSEYAKRAPEIGACIDLATHLAATIRHLHAKHWLHRNLTPEQVMVSRESHETWLLELDRAIEFGSGASDWSGGDPLYMAPEQFGRMGRGIDFRSDLYSLGGTLYYLFTGRPPFEGEDSLKLMHAHMALSPDAPEVVRPDIPAPLSRLLLKLLQKEPDERYQTAHALHQDLLTCQRIWAEEGSLPHDFALGTTDAASRPLFSKRLYGRDTEIEALADALERVKSGSCELWLIKGAPGAGKSVLIEELRARSLEDGWLAQGKFDLYRDQPYAGFASAFAGLADQILVQGESKIEYWRKRVESVLGANAPVLVDWIPDWRFILGELPAPPRLEPRETQVRLARTTVRLLEALAAPDATFILFLDDLQWADSGSRFLLCEIACESNPSGLLLVGTFRDGEVDSAHPLRSVLSQIESSPLPVHTLEVGALSREATLHMLSDAFEKPRDQVEALANLVLTKTENNPFLVQQFVEHMRSLGHIGFDVAAGWTFDLDAIGTADISDDAVELIAARIEHLEPHASEVLVFASFIGDEFDAEMLCALANRDIKAVEFALCALSESGLIVPCRSGFRFVHDRIREASQSLRSQAERAQLHYDTASLLLSRTPETEQAAAAPDIVEHFNRALDRIPVEKIAKVVQLNVWAAQRALEGGAPVAARSYVDRVHAVAERNNVPLDPSLEFDLNFLRAQTRMVAGEYAEADQIARLLVEMQVGPIQFSHAAALRIELYAQVARENEAFANDDTRLAMEIGTLALRKLKAPYPSNPSTARAVCEMLFTYLKIRNLSAADFAREIGAADERQRAILRLEGSMGAIYAIRPNRALVSHACRLRRFREGYTTGFLPASLIGLALLFLMLGRRKIGERIANLCLELLRDGHQSIRTSGVESAAHILNFAWFRPMGEVARDAERAAFATLEEGDVFILASCGAIWANLAFYGGAPLDELLRACRATEDFCRRSHDTGLLGSFQDSSAILECLRGPAKPPPDAAPFTARKRPMTEAYRAFYWVVMNDPARVYECLKDSNSLYGTPDQLSFLRALACTALLRDPRRENARSLKRCLRKDYRTLRWRARLFPENFLHQRLLIDAERARLSKRRREAIDLGLQAIKCARDRNHPIAQALALERVAEMFFEERRYSEGAQQIRRAIELYDKWGASAKAAHLREEHRDPLNLLAR